MKTNNKNTIEKVLTIGAGVAALAAAGYFFFGPDSKKNLKKARGWMLKMKGEVIEKLEEIKDVTEDQYNDIVDAVAKGYVSSGSSAEVAKLTKELKSHWKSISKAALKLKNKKNK